jgi:hypothetical protein
VTSDGGRALLFRRLVPSVAVAALAILSTASPAGAQDLEPRAYTNTPIGLNFLIAGYVYQAGDVATDPALPLEDAQVDVHTAVLAYARSFSLFGMSAKADVIMPYGWLDGSALVQGQREERIVDGFADPRFRVSVNLYGAPALTLEEFTAWEQDVIIGVSWQMSAPLGQYDEDRAVNLGSNRWIFKPELGISKAFGPLILEVAPSVAVFTANDDFFGGKRREQDPIYAIQGHLIYRFGPALWAAVDGTYYGGGRTTVDGEENGDRQSNARVGATLALSVTRNHSVKLYASKAVATRIGGDFDLVGLALQYRWGGGL